MSQQLKDRTNIFGIRIIKMAKQIKGGKIEDPHSADSSFSNIGWS